MTPACGIPSIRYAVASQFAGFSGYAEPEKRLVVAIEAYLDEAGAENTDAIFVLAGFMAPAGTWVEFSDDWRRCLKEPPSISHLHMIEARPLSGEFHNWHHAARDAKLRALGEVIKQYAKKPDGIRAIYFTTPFDLFRRRIVPDLAKPISAVYLWGLFLLIMCIQHDLEKRGVTERFTPIFDNNDTFGPKAKILYPLIREGIGGKLKISLPVQPLFEDDKKFPPLQAADMLAFLLRRSWNGKENFDWLLAELWPTINVSQESLRLCEAHIDLLVNLKGWHETLPIPQDVIDKWAEEVGLDAINSLKRKKKKSRKPA